MFKLDFQKIERSEDIYYHFECAEAMQRNYNPQKPVGLLTGHIDPSDKRYWAKVTREAFFSKLTVRTRMAAGITKPSVEALFKDLGLEAVKVAIEHGDPSTPTYQRNDYVFTADEPAEQTFECWEDGISEYRYTIEYTFAGSEWQAESERYTVTGASNSRCLLINPRTDLGFLKVEVVADLGDAVEYSEMHLSCRPDGEPLDTTLRLQRNSTQSWKLRLPKPWAGQYTYRLTHHLKEGQTITSLPVEGHTSKLLVTNPVGAKFAVTFYNDFEDQVKRDLKRVFVCVDYKDPDKGFTQSAKVSLPMEKASVEVTMAVPAPAKTTYWYSLKSGDNAKYPQTKSIESRDTDVSLSAWPVRK
jgi:hypothetical protein